MILDFDCLNQASLSALEQRLDVYLQSKNSENDVLERLTARLSVLETQLQLRSVV
jgi:hypothetical protein